MKKQTICNKEGHNYLVVKSWSENLWNKEDAKIDTFNVRMPIKTIYKILIVCTKCADTRIVQLEDIQDS